LIKYLKIDDENKKLSSTRHGGKHLKFILPEYVDWGSSPGLLPKYCPGVQLLRLVLGEVHTFFADAA
jgi:hypothetical protein